MTRPRRVSRRLTRVLAAALAITLIPAGTAAAREMNEDASRDIGEAAFAAAESEMGSAIDVESPVALRANVGAGRKLALTFDDGPHPTLTAPILDLLAEYDVKATFFVIGENARAYPDIIARQIAEGHEIGNHTETHPDLSRLSPAAAAGEILAAEDAIFSENEYRARLLRPPCGAATEDLLRLASRLDYDVILWSVDTRDWAHNDTAAIVRTVRQNADGGDVILFHDFISGEAHTLDALRELIPALLADGYEFVTVSELFGLG